MNLLTLQHDSGIVLANRYSICSTCKKKMLEADKKLRPSKAAEQLQGAQDGNLILKVPGAKDSNGDSVYLCKSCLEEYLEQLNAAH